jgi:nucleotidyltransferase substrate binding protein (TIGR01987 family)
MGGLESKTKNLSQALKRFHDAILHYQYGQEGKLNLIGPMDTEDLLISLRDSMIQRFEFSIDLFWKFIKVYLEEHENILVTPITPRSVNLAATKASLLTEREAEIILKMAESRNLTSHVYQENIAQQLSQKLPEFYTIMANVFQRLNQS